MNKSKVLSGKLYYLAISLFFLFVGCGPGTLDDTALKADLISHISILANDSLQGRAFGTDGEEKAAQYLSRQFKKIGTEAKGTDGYFQEFNVSASKNPHVKAKIGDAKNDSSLVGKNVVAWINNQAENTVVIGAHFDHLGMGGVGSLHRGESEIHNGADDNASGVATILALAKILKQKKELKNNYLFIGFTGEENGLWGSNYFNKSPTVDLTKVNYMLNFDMVGRLNEDRSLAVHGTGTSPEWNNVLDSINIDSLSLVKKESGVGPSDHTSFYLQNIPVLHFFTGQHEDYHKPSDDEDKINYEGLVQVIRYTERLITTLDSKDKLAFTKTKDESEDTPRFKVGLGVVPDYLFDGKGMRIDGLTEDKPAHNAGLEKGDIVIKLGDSAVIDMMSYMRALSIFEKGDSTTVIIKRGSQELTKSILF